MTDSEIRALIEQEVTAQLQAMNTKDIASETDIPTLSDAEWDTNNALTSMPVVYNGSTWRKIGLSFLRTLRNAAAVINTAWNSLTNNGTNVTWIPTVNSSGVAGKSSPADLASVLGELGTQHGDGFISSKFYDYVFARPHSCATCQNADSTSVIIPNTFFGGDTSGRCSILIISQNVNTPSIFVLGRKTVVATIYDGSAIHQSDLAFNSDGSLTVTKRKGLSLYFRVLVMEW